MSRVMLEPILRNGRRLYKTPLFRGYFADLDGGVWSGHRRSYFGVEAPYPMQPWIDMYGYHHVTLDIGGRKRCRIAVHRLVARTFFGPSPPDHVVAHLDGDKSNNRLANLADVTQRANVSHRWLHGTMLSGDRSHLSRLSDEECLEILRRVRAGEPRRSIARQHGIRPGTVYALANGSIRKHLTRKRLPTHLETGPFDVEAIVAHLERTEKMRNFVQLGHSITVAAPTGGVASGDGVLIGALFGTAQHDAAEGADLELLTEGVVELPKATPLAIAVGDRLFWSPTAKKLDKTATAQVCVGLATAAAASADVTVRLKLASSTPAGT